MTGWSVSTLCLRAVMAYASPSTWRTVTVPGRSCVSPQSRSAAAAWASKADASCRASATVSPAQLLPSQSAQSPRLTNTRPAGRAGLPSTSLPTLSSRPHDVRMCVSSRALPVTPAMMTHPSRSGRRGEALTHLVQVDLARLCDQLLKRLLRQRAGLGVQHHVVTDHHQRRDR